MSFVRTPFGFIQRPARVMKFEQGALLIEKSLVRSHADRGFVDAAAAPTYLSSNRQMDVKMVEIAVNILGQKPEPNIQPARYWAVDVIKAYFKVPLSSEVQAALIENRALTRPSFVSSIDYSSPIGAPIR